jgi:hypothetical protein
MFAREAWIRLNPNFIPYQSVEKVKIMPGCQLSPAGGCPKIK